MKIVTKTGNLLDVAEGHIVHGCNSHGIMGAGVALAIKNKYPNVYKEYRGEYEGCGLILGKSYPVMVSDKLTVWNAITQLNMGGKNRQVSYDAIQTCFETINAHLQSDNVYAKEIHIPLIGCGLANGNWNIIKIIIEETVVFPTTLWILPS